MYLTYIDYSNNEFSLLNALKKQQKGTKYRYTDVEATRKNDRLTIIDIYYKYASIEHSGWRSSVYRVEIDIYGKTDQTFSKNEMTELWAEHIKKIKSYRTDQIKKELIQRALTYET